MIITATSEPLTEEKQDRIRSWLSQPEAQWVEQIVKGQIASYIANGGNSAMDQAVGVLSSGDVPQSTKVQFAVAAGLKIFLATLNELQAQKTFSTTTLKVE